MTRNRLALLSWILLCASTVVLASFAQTDVPKAKARPSLIAKHEAEIIVYLLPAAREVRSKYAKEHVRAGWELQHDSGKSQQDYYSFRLFAVGKHVTGGSGLLGYYTVNGYTVDVWDESSEDKPQLVEDDELSGVQRILRQAHNIGPEEIAKYRNAPFLTEAK